MRHLIFKFRFIGLLALAMVGAMLPVSAQAAGGGSTAAHQAAGNPSLGSADGFAVLAGRAATCTTTTITGKVGVNFTTTNGCGGQLATTAFQDFQTALGTKPACTKTVGTTFPDATTTLGPGTYCTGVGALTFTNQTLNLTGNGPWNFVIGDAFTTTNLTVVSSNPCNVFWWVKTDVTLTVNSAAATPSTPFQGTILGGRDITITGVAGHTAALTLTGHVWATRDLTMTDATIVGCNAGGTVVCRNGEGDNENEDEDAGQSSEKADKDGNKAACKPAKQHCNQGVGNGPEGCDPGNSNQGDESRSNDELGGTPGNPGRKGGNTSGAQTASISSHENVAVAAKSDSHTNNTAAVAVAAKSTTRVMSSVSNAAKGKSDLHANGKSNSKNK